jgi:hypothetical protein
MDNCISCGDRNSGEYPHSVKLCGCCLNNTFKKIYTTSKMLSHVKDAACMWTKHECECCGLDNNFLMTICLCPDCLEKQREKFDKTKDPIDDDGINNAAAMNKAIAAAITSLKRNDISMPKDVIDYFDTGDDFAKISYRYVDNNMYTIRPRMSFGDLDVQKKLDEDLLELSRDITLDKRIEKLESLLKRRDAFLKVRKLHS